MGDSSSAAPRDPACGRYLMLVSAKWRIYYEMVLAGAGRNPMSPPSCNWLPGAGRAFKYFNISHSRVSCRPSPIRLRKRSKEEAQLHPLRFIKRRRWDKWKVCTNNCTPARLPIHFLRKAFYPVFIWGQDMIYFWDEQMQIMHVEQCNVMHLNHDKNPSFL